MNKKGFTLIELLAVIVILAIIALIATPIVLNIIEDSRISGNKRSIDGYANAIEYAVANSQLSNATGKIAGTFTTEDGKTLTGTTTLTVDYDGDVVCDTIEVYNDGNIYLDGCKVNGEEVDYVYGKKVFMAGQYYSWSSGNIGEEVPSDAQLNLSDLDYNHYHSFFLRLQVDSNKKVTDADVCAIVNETEYCLDGLDTNAYQKNIEALQAYSLEAGAECKDWGTFFQCHGGGGSERGGTVSTSGAVSFVNMYASCHVIADGSFRCNAEG